MMENLFIRSLYDLSHTAAATYLEQYTYPWEALAGIGEFILKLGETLSTEEYEKRGEDIWVAKSATIFPTAYIHGPAIIGPNTVCIYSWKRFSRRKLRSGKLDGTQKCHSIRLCTGTTL